MRIELELQPGDGGENETQGHTKLLVLVVDACKRQCAELELCLPTANTSKKIIRESLPDHTNASVELDESNPFAALEIWGWPDRGEPDFMHHIESLRVDFEEWARSGWATREFPLEVVTGLTAKKNEPALCLRVSRVPSTNPASAAYENPTAIHLDDSGSINAPSEGNAIDGASFGDFRLRMPSIPISRSRRFREVQLGQIIHEHRTDILESLLPMILYAVPPSNSQPTPPCVIEATDPMHKALILLQLSCQYAQHCAGVLSNHTRDLNQRKLSYQNHLDKQKQRMRRLKNRTKVIQYEDHMLTSSLNTLRAMLHELDPAALASVQSGNDSQMEPSSVMTVITDNI